MEAEHLPHLAGRFREQRFLYLPHLMTAAAARNLDLLSRGLEARRVNCHGGANTWQEQAIESGALHRCFEDAGTVDFLRLVLGTEMPLERLVCWTSRYREGEHINPHLDASGSVQVLLCLAACPLSNGGTLVVGESPTTRLHLQPGDALVFKATDLLHATTPLRASPEVPEPLRVVAVGRYFFGQASRSSLSGGC